MYSQALRRALRACLGLALLIVPPLAAADTVWTNLTGNQRWNILINWSAGVPDAADLARLPGLPTAAPTVVLDAGMQASALAIESDYLLFAGSLRLATGNIDVVGANTRATVASELRGSAGLTKLGAGTLVLAGAATYTGTTRVANGTLELRSVGERLPDASALVLDEGARLRLAGSSFTETVGTLVGTGTVLFEGGEHTLRVGADNGNDEFLGNLIDAGVGARLVKVGTGTQILRGANVLGRGLDVRAGELGLTRSDTHAGSVTVGGGAALDMKDSSLTVHNDVTLAAGGRLTLRGGAHLTLRNALGAGGTLWTEGTLELLDANALIDLSGLDFASAPVGAAGGRITITGGQTTVSGGAGLRLAGGRGDVGDTGGPGGVLTLANGGLRLDQGTIDLAGGAAGRRGVDGEVGLLDVTGGTFDFVAGRVTNGQVLVTDAAAALIGARLRVATGGKMRLSSDFANLGGELLIEGGSVDLETTRGSRGRQVVSTGLVALTGRGQLTLNGGRGAAATDSAPAGRGGDGGTLRLSGDLRASGEADVFLGGGGGGAGLVVGSQLFAGGKGGDGGHVTISEQARVEYSGGNLDLRGGLGGGGARGGSGTTAVSAAGHGGNGGSVTLEDGRLEILHGATLRLDGGDGGSSPLDRVGLAGGDGGRGGRLEVGNGSVIVKHIPGNPVARISVAGGEGSAPGGRGGDGGELLTRGGGIHFLTETELDMRGGRGGRGYPGLASVNVLDGGPGGDGGAGGRLTVAQGVISGLHARLDLRGGDGGSGGAGTRSGGDGGNGGAGGRLLIEGGSLVLNGGEADLRGGFGGAGGSGKPGRAGDAGSLEQRGGSLELKGTHLVLSGLAGTGPGDGGHGADGSDAGNVLLLGGDVSVLGNLRDEDIVADGGNGYASTQAYQHGGHGGRGGRLVLDGSGTREFGGSVLLSFDGGAGGRGSVSGGNGGAGGDLTVRDSNFSLVFDAAASFSGGDGGIGRVDRFATGAGDFGDGGAGGSFTVSGGNVVIGFPRDFRATRGSRVRLGFDGGDAGNLGYFVDLESPPDSESRAGRGGFMLVVGGDVDVNSDAMLTLRGGSGGRISDETGTPVQGGDGGTLSVQGGRMAVRGGALLDLSGGHAVNRPDEGYVLGGRGGDVRIGGSGHLVLDGGALFLAGGQGLSPQVIDGPRGTAGRLLVNGGQLTLKRGLVTAVEDSRRPDVDPTWGELSDTRLVGTTLDIQGGVVDATSVLRLDDARVNLGGGTLRARHIVLGGASAFDFTGGTLDLGRFEGDLHNRGGVLEVGGDAGYTRVVGDFSQAKEGLLVLDLLGLEVSEALVIDHGRADLGGRLEIRLAEHVQPLAGSDFDILVADEGLFGAFYAFTLPERAGLRFNLVTRPDRLVLEVRAVPLPSTALLVGPALVVLGCRRRHARRASTVQARASLH
ncbi:MAG: autotransporter-associated beta strand repeat-containing protein [Gammaproteobacteria bacterium]|nr:autotransporter-associated beta strand repeat-containing protein [Gammaproteobacteria bacterium]